MEMTKARVKWVNSHGLKEEQEAPVTFLKTAVAYQEGPPSLFRCLSSSPLLIIMTGLHCKQALSGAPDMDSLTYPYNNP